ncbi:alpha/beta hydrolase [Gordonia jinghuaiqii]|uniref:alpha/beta hydrolase n=1 Tax=Gordonia jinghuaiqii TaxID=2758710 RepID=UPI001CB79933|nr:alpha/beta hydrolase-fold protein [Gordonia jinghuaiqii]
MACAPGWSARRRVVAMGVAVICALSAGMIGAGPGHAGAPGELRSDAGCEWRTPEERAQRLQTCTFESESLGRKATVQVRASDKKPGQTERGIYFLDGLGSNPDFSTWTLPEAGTTAAYSSGYTLVLPAGGAGEWMTDWKKAPTGKSVAPQWSRFIGKELPAYLERNFGVDPTRNAIVGVSMSAGPAVILALDHPEVFKVARSYSGYYPTDNPVGWLAIPAIQKERADIENGRTAMWGDPEAPGNAWAHHDVMSRIGEVKETKQKIIVSTGNGIPTNHELREANKLLEKELAADPNAGPALLQKAATALALGVVLESGALVSTGALQATAAQLGLPISFGYRNGGHNWAAWAADAPDDARVVERALEAS